MDYAKTIESKYDSSEWKELLHNIFGKQIEFCEKTIKVFVNSNIAQSVSYTGNIKLSDGHTIAIYEVELSDNVIIERNRAGIRNLLCTHWKGKGCAGAFMFCFRQKETTFRFSYVSESFVFAEDGTLKKESTDTKRFTYLLGEGHRSRTAIDRFKKLGTKAKKSESTLKDITEAFSVEALSNEFFKEYKQQYENIIKDLPKEKSVRDYVKKFMGRLVFIQFLQKKGWMGCPKGEGWSNGDPDFLQNLFKNSNYKDTFVQDVLEPLFKDINTKRENDLVTDEKIGKEIKVPYLNGGLFEQDTQVFPLPYEKINEKINEKIEDLLNFFSNYNFTIDENDPDDAEIGVDPEMLGRIFENFLEDNKDKGAFYTPKEIVQYMCRESLIAYLQTGIEEETTKEAIRQFVTTHHPEPIETIKQEIDKKLQEVKICDPAIGSGAFPMGMLKELFECRKAIEGIEGNKASEIKKEIIQQNIYGVDIEKGAVDIARLRFWLALIVDEGSPHILPNLDFKIMQGNSLLEQYKGVDLSKLHDIKKEEKPGMQVSLFENKLDCIRKELSNKLEDYFARNNQEEKKELRKEIKENVQKQIKELHYDNDENLNLDGIQDISATSEFFLWHTWFADVFEKGGFNIVIGNPPYVFARNSEEKGMTNKAKVYYYKNFKLAQYQVNLYPLFVEQGTKLLTENGVFAYIIPNNWMTINTYKEFRKYILTKSDVQIANFYKRIFKSADVDSSIIIYRNFYAENNIKLFESTSKEEFCLVKEVPASILLSEKDYIINIERYKNDSFNDVMLKIESSALPIKGNFGSVKCGIKAYQKGKGKPKQTEDVVKKKIFHSLVKESSNYYEYLEGTDVHRYVLTWVSKEYINYGVHLAEPRKDWNLFSAPRILVRQIPSKPPYCINACYTDKVLINDLNSMNLISIKCNPLYLLGVLNSRPISFWFEHKFGKLQRGLFPQFKINELAIFPIPNADQSYEELIATIVGRILATKKANPLADISTDEREIDNLVYSLYDLTYEEVLIVEPEFKERMSKEEYEKFKKGQ